MTEKMPEFRTISMPDIDGWYAADRGGKGFTGRLLGSRNIKTPLGNQDILVVELATSISAVSSKDNKSIVALEPGKTLGVGVKHKLLDLLRYSDSGAMIRVDAIGKIPIDGGKTMWNYKVEVEKGIRPSGGPDEYSDEIPF